MALEAQNNPFTSVLMVEAADPEAIGDADPSAGQRRLVVGADHLLYLLDDSGVKHLVSGTAGLTDPMTTRGDIIVRNASNVTARLGRGSAGTVLSSDGADVAWAAPASSGALVLLEQHTASSSSSLDFTSTISSTYDEYIFECVGIRPATDGAMFGIRVGTGGGPTYDTGSNYGYSSFWKAIGSTAAVASWGTTSTLLSAFNDSASGGLSNVSGTMLSGTFHMYDPQNAVNAKPFSWETVFNYYADDGYYRVTGGGLYTQATALTAIRFMMHTGNIAVGTVRAYGVAK